MTSRASWACAADLDRDPDRAAGRRRSRGSSIQQRRGAGRRPSASARLGSGPARHVSPRQNSFSRLHGNVQTPEGETWLAGTSGIIRLKSSDLDKLLENPAQPVPIQRFERPMVSGACRMTIAGGRSFAVETDGYGLRPRPVPFGWTRMDIARSRTPPAVSIASLTADKVLPRSRQRQAPARHEEYRDQFRGHELRTRGQQRSAT